MLGSWSGREAAAPTCFARTDLDVEQRLLHAHDGPVDGAEPRRQPNIVPKVLIQDLHELLGRVAMGRVQGGVRSGQVTDPWGLKDGCL